MFPRWEGGRDTAEDVNAPVALAPVLTLAKRSTWGLFHRGIGGLALREPPPPAEFTKQVNVVSRQV